MIDITDMVLSWKRDSAPEYLVARVKNPGFFASHVMSPDSVMSINIGGRAVEVMPASAEVDGDEGEVMFRLMYPIRDLA